MKCQNLCKTFLLEATATANRSTAPVRPRHQKFAPKTAQTAQQRRDCERNTVTLHLGTQVAISPQMQHRYTIHHAPCIITPIHLHTSFLMKHNYTMVDQWLSSSTMSPLCSSWHEDLLPLGDHGNTNQHQAFSKQAFLRLTPSCPKCSYTSVCLCHNHLLSATQIARHLMTLKTSSDLFSSRFKALMLESSKASANCLEDPCISCM